MEPGEITELSSRPLGSPPQEDGEEEQRVTWFQKARDKLANVDSKKCCWLLSFVLETLLYFVQ